MKVAFFSNILHHHQTPFCEEMIKLLGATNFTFVSTRPMAQSLLNNGYSNFEDESYNLCAFKSPELYNKALQLANDADVVVIGSAPLDYVTQRIKDNKITFKYNERWFKKPLYRSNFIRIIIYLWRYDIRHRAKNLYMLCASAFQAGDCHSVFAYPQKTFKWGYFTATPQYDIDKLIEVKSGVPIRILWCARMLKLKHPELAVNLAQRLKEIGVSFQMEMIGEGECYEQTERLIKEKSLQDVVSLLGVMPNVKVLAKMKQAHIFIFTSDRNEGWGAVLNEAMSCGCLPIASNKIGAAPFLIKDGVNGFLFKSGDLDSLTKKCLLAINDREKLNAMSKQAYLTMQNEWSPEVAAKNFIALSQSLLDGKANPIIEGPCSNAN